MPHLGSDLSVRSSSNWRPPGAVVRTRIRRGRLRGTVRHRNGFAPTGRTSAVEGTSSVRRL